jgi:hypothetical protein
MTTISRLEALGVPAAKASEGPVETKVVIHSASQLRSLLDLGLDKKGRQAHYEALFASQQPAGAPTEATQPAADDGGLSIVNRITEHVFGNRVLSAQDSAEIAPAFPMTLHVSLASGPLTVSSRYDLSTPDGSPRTVTFTDVTLAPGGYFVCQNTPLTFICSTLTRTGERGTNAPDFSILGLTGETPATPATPAGASRAADGGPGECSSAGIAGHGGGTGSPGAPGTPGTEGAPGNPGRPSMQATIKITDALNMDSLTVFTQSGPGGQGGNGGAGGPGQSGGNGGNGVTCDCTGNAGGPGGNGGAGGPGGRAGNGGNGVDAAGDIAIFVPSSDDVRKVSTSSAPAAPGGPGQPGPGGPSGAGGASSSGGKNNSGGSAGGTGSPGAVGGQGVPGTVTGNSAQFTVTPL